MAYGSFNAGPGKAPDEDVVRTNQIGVPGGIATLDADGHLTESQRWEVDGYKKAETDQRISAAVDNHNGAENAHSDIRAVEGNIALYHDFLRGRVTGDDTIVLSSESTGGQGGGGGQHQGGGSGLAGKLLVQ